MSERSYDGPALDGTVQYITERSYDGGDDGDDEGTGETVEVIDADQDADGEVTVENVPIPTAERPDVEGQSTWADWGWSA